MYRTTNGGTNWSLVLSETGFYDAVNMVNATTGFMAGDPVGGRWSLWKTTNGGANWDSSGLYLPVIHAAEAGWNNAMSVVYPKIWIGTNDTVVIYSSNFGTSWSRYKTPGEVNGYALCFDWTEAPFGLLAGSVAMLQTSNNGMNWSSVTMLGTGNVVGITFTTLPLDNFVSPAWYVRTSTSIYSSYNGSSWATEYTAPAGNYNAISQAKPGFGIWSVRSNGGISYHTIIADVKKTENGVPEKLGLSQNYPNPFNPTTNIKFQITNNKFVILKVYDNLGKEVRTLVQQELKAGYYIVNFNAENLPSGVYFYKLTADGFSDVKKMALIK
jgi:hypothetical protein